MISRRGPRPCRDDLRRWLRFPWAQPWQQRRRCGDESRHTTAAVWPSTAACSVGDSCLLLSKRDSRLSLYRLSQHCAGPVVIRSVIFTRCCSYITPSDLAMLATIADADDHGGGTTAQAKYFPVDTVMASDVDVDGFRQSPKSRQLAGVDHFAEAGCWSPELSIPTEARSFRSRHEALSIPAGRSRFRGLFVHPVRH